MLYIDVNFLQLFSDIQYRIDIGYSARYYNGSRRFNPEFESLCRNSSLTKALSLFVSLEWLY